MDNKSVDVTIRPVAVNEEIPEHHYDHRDRQGEIVGQKFCCNKTNREKRKSSKYSRKKWFQDGDNWYADD